jgi:SAM-dependent methyltransferase
MDPREHWRSVYQTKRPDEVSWYQASPEPSLAALDRAGALPSMSLVDVGAGASTLVDALLGRGWRDVTLVDIAEPALEAARQRLGDKAGQVQWEVADVRHWRPDRSFDIWHDRAVFHFLTGVGERTLYKRALTEGTRSGSLAILATFALDGPETCSGLPVQRYDATSLAIELGDEFAPVADWTGAHVTPWGAEQRFQWCIFRRQ